eukprot:SAG31_NODE_9671_length_1243_cov_1.538462_2_plen_147_part_00
MPAAQLCQEETQAAAARPVAWLGATPTRHLDWLLGLELGRRPGGGAHAGACASGRTGDGHPAPAGPAQDETVQRLSPELDAFIARSGAEGALPDQVDTDPVHMGRDVLSTPFTATCPGAQTLRSFFPDFPVKKQTESNISNLTLIS